MSVSSLKLAAAGALALAGAAIAAAPASAAPMLDPGVAHASDLTGAQPEAVRWVCGPYRCWWRPGPRFYGGYYGPRFYGYGPRFYGGGPRFYGGYGGWRGGWGGGYRRRFW